MKSPKKDQIYQLLVNRMREASVVPPQSVGPLTFFYKQLGPYFKFYPWKTAVLLSAVFSLWLYFLLGPILVKIVSVLQFGF